MYKILTMDKTRTSEEYVSPIVRSIHRGKHLHRFTRPGTKITKPHHYHQHPLEHKEPPSSGGFKVNCFSSGGSQASSVHLCGTCWKLKASVYKGRELTDLLLPILPSLHHCYTKSLISTSSTRYSDSAFLWTRQRTPPPE